MCSMNIGETTQTNINLESKVDVAQKRGVFNGRDVALVLAAYSEGQEKGASYITSLLEKSIKTTNVTNFQEIEKSETDTSKTVLSDEWKNIPGTNCYIKDYTKAIENFQKDTGIESCVTEADTTKIQQMLENMVKIGNKANCSFRDFVPVSVPFVTRDENSTTEKMNRYSAVTSFVQQQIIAPVSSKVDTIKENMHNALSEGIKMGKLEEKEEKIGFFSFFLPLFKFVKTLFSFVEKKEQKSEQKTGIGNWNNINIRENPKGYDGADIRFDFQNLKKNNFKEIDPTFESQIEIKHGKIETEKNEQCSVSHLKGRRKDMEDTHFNGTLTIGNQQVQFSGISDGHGGTQASKFIQTKFQTIAQEHFNKFIGVDGTATSEELFHACRLLGVALQEALMKERETEKSSSGATMSVAIEINGSIWAVNVGDSRIIAVGDRSIHQLTTDAAPENELFAKEVIDRGGGLTKDKKRVLHHPKLPNAGGIAVTRSIGDTDTKGVTALAEVVQYPINGPMHILLGCDGVFEQLTSEEIGMFIQKKIREGASSSDISEGLAKLAFLSGSQDNITAMVVPIGQKGEKKGA